jgi:hypothetical protein
VFDDGRRTVSVRGESRRRGIAAVQQSRNRTSTKRTRECAAHALAHVAKRRKR